MTSATSCVETAISECGSELPLEIRQIAQFLISAVNFECVEEFERQYCTIITLSAVMQQNFSLRYLLITLAVGLFRYLIFSAVAWLQITLEL